MLSSLVVLAILVGGGFYLRSTLVGVKQPRAELTEEQIRQKWRELGFFCELDDEKKVWILTGSRAGLLFFPDLLLGYVNDPGNAADGSTQHYDPYGSLQIMTWHEAGFGGNAIRGSLVALAHLAELVEAKLASAQAGERLRIREEFSTTSPYSLVLDVRPDGFDPASTDREHLGFTTAVPTKAPDKGAAPSK
jgi:hypothetical protein